MTPEEAKKLKYGDRVRCPADRGDKPFTGTVISAGGTVQTNIRGEGYVWVSLKEGGVWPSNRLGRN